MPKGKEPALWAIALDMAAGTLSLSARPEPPFGFQASGSLYLPLLLLVFHIQTVIFVDFWEAADNNRPFILQQTVSLALGLVALFTNAITVKALLSGGPF